MRRFHGNWEPQVSGVIMRECVSEDCTMDHVLSFTIEEERRLALVAALIGTPAPLLFGVPLEDTPAGVLP